MTVRTARRIEVRLDAERAERLAHVLESSGRSVSEFVRDAIDAAARASERNSVSALLESFRVSPLKVPSPEDLKQELEDAACPGEELCQHSAAR